VAGAAHDPSRQHDRVDPDPAQLAPGTKYGIPFPVFARAAYGITGSNLPALMRAAVACGWFGIQAWIGGEALHTFLSAVVPGWAAPLVLVSGASTARGAGACGSVRATGPEPGARATPRVLRL